MEVSKRALLGTIAALLVLFVVGILGKWEAENGNDCFIRHSLRETAAKAEKSAGENTTGNTTENTAEYMEIKRIALTFDDGPHPSYTEKLLDGLKERGVRATFFVTGEHAELHPDIVRRMSKEGHLIGNHTYSHIQLTSGNKETFKEELRRTNEVITKITGNEVLYVRPPYGSWDKAFEKELNMLPVLWSVDPLDWCCNDAACVTRKVVKAVSENDIILLHDYYASSVEAALMIVDTLQEEGYEFVTVEELLLD